MPSVQYLIIGNSIAAINAVEGIRELDKKGSIAIVSEESGHVYSRPLISYYLCEKVDEEGMRYRPSSFYHDHAVETFFGKKAVGLSIVKKMVTLDDGQEILFDRMLLTTGGVPFMPEIPGRGLRGVFNFTTFNDSRSVRDFIAEHQVKRALVLGGGLIGLKVTEALMALGIQVTIVELADRILSATFDLTASRIIEQALNRAGCSILTGTTVKEFHKGEKGRVGSAFLTDTKSIECDLAIIAIGVRPRLDLVKGTEIRVDKGVLVDEQLQTSVRDIYAAGDVVECYDFILNTHRPVAILPNASRQGRIAGFNMAGGKRGYEGCLAMNSVELAGIPTISVGLTDPSAIPDEERKKGIEVLQYCQEKDSIYKKIVIEENRIIGAIFIGRIDRAGIYTGLIKDRVDISSFKEHLLKEDFGLISLPKEYRKHLVTGQGIEV